MSRISNKNTSGSLCVCPIWREANRYRIEKYCGQNVVNILVFGLAKHSPAEEGELDRTGKMGRLARSISQPYSEDEGFDQLIGFGGLFTVEE